MKTELTQQLKISKETRCSLWKYKVDHNCKTLSDAVLHAIKKAEGAN